VILFIISITVAKMSLSSLFYSGYYSHKQLALILAENGVKEVIGRLIANNEYGKNCEDIRNTSNPDDFR